ncbi:histidine ammonia-lyase [Listeria floridensis FSL S10-1187]|uniref:Histidine ammonia-lyase n=1 Tax=Listeria floridensis FSL S10-1187 TaxID=1265817 RepID=A0ABN0RH21_9LIST|nr:hypothetical protein [Listeria floridensis]EUJ33163.1 histidine ammonia-lyase [Listeria floridensis FSL S10-1187]
MTKEVVLTGNDLTLDEVIGVSRCGWQVKIDQDAIEAVKKIT